MTERQKANLRPFEKGRSGNPKGRPKGSVSRSTIARRLLATEVKAWNPITSQLEKLTSEDRMMIAQIVRAINGSTAAYRAVMDSAYGKPSPASHTQSETASPALEPIRIHINFGRGDE